MKDITKILVALIKTVLSNEPLDEKIKTQITPEILEELFTLSNHHDVAHIVSDVLYKNGLLTGNVSVAGSFKAAQFAALIRYSRLEQAQQQIYNVLKQENIPFVPLKGSVIRKYYNEPYMRTSCDIDILVHEEDLSQAAELLTKKLNYSAKPKSYHDISLFSPDGVHLELHFNILENMEKIDVLLGRVWNYAVPVNGLCQYVLTNEFLMFHIIAHAAYHFINGGCGIKPFSDIYLMKEKMPFDKDLFEKMCEDSGILQFYNKCCDLIDVWFGKRQHDSVTIAMEDYVISGGIYGTLANKLAVERTEVNNDMGYLLKRIFMKKSDLQITYPLLKKYPALLPYYTVKRWFGLLDLKKQKRILSEFKINSRVTEREISDASDLIRSLGLNH